MIGSFEDLGVSTRLQLQLGISTEEQYGLGFNFASKSIAPISPKDLAKQSPFHGMNSSVI